MRGRFAEYIDTQVKDSRRPEEPRINPRPPFLSRLRGRFINL